MENKQGLGIKVFYYYLSKNVLMGFLLLIISIIVASYKTTIASKLTFVIPVSAADKIMGILVLVLFVITFLILIINTLASWLKYKSCYFIVGENTFTIRTGILSKTETSIPYSQIQNMNIEQSFSDRMMGICHLHILTAGNDNNNKEGEAGANFSIIDINVANGLRETVLQKTGQKKA